MPQQSFNWLCTDCKSRDFCLSLKTNQVIDEAYKLAETSIRGWGFEATGRLCPSGSAALVLEALNPEGKKVAIKYARSAGGANDERFRASIKTSERETHELLRKYDEGFLRLAATSEENAEYCEPLYYPFLVLELLAPEDGWKHGRALLSAQLMSPIWEIVPMASQWFIAMQKLMDINRNYTDIKSEHIFWNTSSMQMKVIDFNQCQESVYSATVSREVVMRSCRMIFGPLYSHALLDKEVRHALEMPVSNFGLGPVPVRTQEFLNLGNESEFVSPVVGAFFRNSENQSSTINEAIRYLGQYTISQRDFTGSLWPRIKDIYHAAISGRDSTADAIELLDSPDISQEEYIELKRIVYILKLI